MTSDSLQSSYALLDTGGGEKLERFGERTLARPSAACMWKKGAPHLWSQADAKFIPGGGWKFNSGSFESWPFAVNTMKIELRLQSNGLIGFFPEHTSYIPDIIGHLRKRKRNGSSPFKVLNLFAFTGTATVFAASAGAHVTHVDLSKKALTWAEQNLRTNKVDKNLIRFICDDAIKFLEREVKRKSSYDIVIADPPSFSRTTKSSSWKLEEIIVDLCKNCFSLLGKEAGAFFLTCHDPMMSPQILQNILGDFLPNPDASIKARDLLIYEADRGRPMPAGHFASAMWE